MVPYTSSRFSFPSPAKFSSLANASVSKECRLEVRAAPRSQIFCELIRRKVGSTDTHSASFTSSYPAKRLYTDCRSKSARGSWVLRLQRRSLRCHSMSSPMPRCSSNSRTRISPASEVICDPWKSTFNDPLKLSWNGLVCFSPMGCGSPRCLECVQACINKGVRGP